VKDRKYLKNIEDNKEEDTEKEEISVIWRKYSGPQWLTKYEKAKILGIRARQLLEGAEPLIKVPPNLKDPLKIAELELQENKLPFLIKRVRGEAEEYTLSLEEFKSAKEKSWQKDIE
jgi:RNA polymerase Rpb6.